jgi:hypothetical protein
LFNLARIRAPDALSGLKRETLNWAIESAWCVRTMSAHERSHTNDEEEMRFRRARAAQETSASRILGRHIPDDLGRGVAGSNPATPTSSTSKALIGRSYLQTLIN